MAVSHQFHHIGIGSAIVPRLVEDVFKWELLHIEALKRRADALEVGTAIFQRRFEQFARLLHIALQHRVAAKVAEVAPNIRLTVELIVHTPHLHTLAEVVEHRHLALWQGGEHGFGHIFGPLVALIVEEPAHLQPFRFLVDGFQRLIHMAREAADVATIVTWSLHFVEKVDAIDVVGAKEASLLLQEFALDFRIQWVFGVEEIGLVILPEAVPRVETLDVGFRKKFGELLGHMAGESRKHRAHVQRTLARQNLLLEHHLTIEPLLGQRSAPHINVCHAVPREIHRTCEITAHLLIGHAHATPHIVPHAFLTSDGKRHIHAIECHPVDHTLPVVPIEKRHSVAECAVIEEEAFWHTGID